MTTPWTTEDEQRRSFRDVFRDAFVSGMAVVVPVLVTLIVLAVAVNSIYKYLDLFSDYLTQLPIITIIPGVVFVTPETLIELLIPVALLYAILFVGLVVNSSNYGELAVDYFDAFIAAIPGIGSVYESFRQMSDVMLESDTQNFREVKLVEFPHEGAYTLGFVTTETPESLREPTGHAEMLTLFLPLAPNPVMGGHLVHMPAEKVMDVDMSVEEGIRAVVTSGVAVSGGGAGAKGLSPEQLSELGAVEHADQQFTPEQPSPKVRRGENVHTGRTERYDQRVSPETASTPGDIVRREHAEEAVGETDPTPGDVASESGVAVAEDRTPGDIEMHTNQEATEFTPAELERRHDAGKGDDGPHTFDADRPAAVDPNGGDDEADPADSDGSEATDEREDRATDT
jgi:uncharacterized membrane protein